MRHQYMVKKCEQTQRRNESPRSAPLLQEPRTPQVTVSTPTRGPRCERFPCCSVRDLTLFDRRVSLSLCRLRLLHKLPPAYGNPCRPVARILHRQNSAAVKRLPCTPGARSPAPAGPCPDRTSPEGPREGFDTPWCHPAPSCSRKRCLGFSSPRACQMCPHPLSERD